MALLRCHDSCINKDLVAMGELDRCPCRSKKTTEKCCEECRCGSVGSSLPNADWHVKHLRRKRMLMRR